MTLERSRFLIAERPLETRLARKSSTDARLLHVVESDAGIFSAGFIIRQGDVLDI